MVEVNRYLYDSQLRAEVESQNILSQEELKTQLKQSRVKIDQLKLVFNRELVLEVELTSKRFASDSMYSPVARIYSLADLQEPVMEVDMSDASGE